MYKRFYVWGESSERNEENRNLTEKDRQNERNVVKVKKKMGAYGGLHNEKKR